MTFEGHFGDLRTFVTLCAQLTHDLLAIAKFLVRLRDVEQVRYDRACSVTVKLLRLQTTSHSFCNVGCAVENLS